jgi:L,D-transpeptidase YcbB
MNSKNPSHPKPFLDRIRSRANLYMPLVIILCAIGLFPGKTTLAQGLTAQMSEQLRTRFELSADPHLVVCGGGVPCGSHDLARFYILRDFDPLWISGQGARTEAYDLLRAIEDAASEGLSPQDYHLQQISPLLKDVGQWQLNPSEMRLNTLVDLELLLSDAFLLYASHLSSGRVNPLTINPDWAVTTRQVDLVQVLDHAIQNHTIEQDLKELLPPGTQYHRLKKALPTYREIIQGGGWPAVSDGPSLRKGDRGQRVGQLHARLIESEELKPGEKANPETFDGRLEHAVLRFQKRHGLAADGVVGKATLAALNVTAEDRFRQIEVNMERLRWIPNDPCDRHILINIAEFQLRVIDNGIQVLDMRVVVGKDYRPTPIVTGDMKYLVLNPFWRIPHKLAIEDFLPKIRANKNFFKKEHIRVFQSWQEGAPEITPDSVDWNRVGEKQFSYKLVQNPGPSNALGSIKFVFQNKFSIYLHDTPAKHLFTQKKRNFSSGCIRIEKPVDLAAYLVSDNPDWTREKLVETIRSSETKVIRMLRPIAVHLLYSTAWADKDGALNFREDFYGRDKLLYAALKGHQPAPN